MKRLIATTTLLSLLLALFMFAPGGIVMAEENYPPEYSQNGIAQKESVPKKSVLNESISNKTITDESVQINSTTEVTPVDVVTDPRDNLVVIGAQTNRPVNPASGRTTTLTLTFVNTSTSPIWDISVTLSGFSPGISLATNQDFTVYPAPPPEAGGQVFNVRPGVSFNAIFDLAVSGNVETGNYEFDFLIRYNTAPTGPTPPTHPDPPPVHPPPSPQGTETSTGRAFVNIVRPIPPEPPPPEIPAPPEPPEPPPPPPTPIPPSVPRVIISHQQLSVDSVIAGSPFDLTITLLNTSRNRNVGNMEVTITDAEGVFVPVVGVNSFFIERLNAQETTEIVISLLARLDTETGSHPLTVTINYEDNLNAPHSTAPTINIPVYMPVRIETRSLSFEDEGGGSAFLSFQIINLSRAPLYNVGVRLEGPFMAEQFQEFHFGTINAGAFDFFEDTIFPFEFGEVSGEIVLEFEDSSGAPGELRIPISTWIGEPFFPEFPEGGDRWPEDGDFGWEEEANGEGIPWWIWAIIGGGVLLAGIIAIVVVRRIKRKKKEAADFDE